MTRGRLVIMGSGETAPTMVKVHRFVAESAPGPIVALDTPYGFQENADELSAKTIDYFRESVGAALTVASFRRADDIGTHPYETAMARVAEAKVVFAGPGSPSYALGVWEDSAVPGLLRETLERGGTVTFASAAALTLGRFTVPVYEIYKVGAAPQWLMGLDVFELVTGVPAAVIPHYDNAEGGTHDTRFCYLGERRLAILERDLPEEAIVFGVDEHTAAIVDGDAGTVTVMGRSGVTIRRQGTSRRFEAGTTFAFAELSATSGAAAADAAAAEPVMESRRVRRESLTGSEDSGSEPGTLLDEAARAEVRFTDAVAARDGAGAASAALALEASVRAWANDPSQTDDVDRARATLRSILVRLGETAQAGLADPATALAPFVDTLLELRAAARAAGRFDEADQVRDRLVAAGIEVNDGPDGTEWRLI